MPGVMKSEKNPLQPPQPTDLQGLLRFAMEATRAEDAAGSSTFETIDDERRKFLEEALSSMTIDVVHVLVTQIKELEGVQELSPIDDPSKYVKAFDTILDYVDDIDVANDFHKIGGFTIFEPCFKSSNTIVRAKACNLLAELCQNNPYCQNVMVNNGFVKMLIDILDKDVDEVCVKALYALSCNVRENLQGYQTMIDDGGLEVLLQTIKKKHDKLRTKTAFLLNSLCCCIDIDGLEDKLTEMGYLGVLINCLGEEIMPSHEHILFLLRSLIESSAIAANICKMPEYNFRSILENVVARTENCEQFAEEYEYAKVLLSQLFPEESQ